MLNASIVFAGDPKQLGPVIKSQMAIKMGYGEYKLWHLKAAKNLQKKDKRSE